MAKMQEGEGKQQYVGGTAQLASSRRTAKTGSLNLSGEGPENGAGTLENQDRKL
jgi:hypothetical protein